MLKVIIIDDEQWSVNYMLNIVDWQKNGAEIAATFNNAVDALEFISQNTDIDIVFVDVEMPEMTGIEFLKRAGSVLGSAELIIISSYDTFGYAQEAIRSGAKDYLLKPIEQDDIIRILSETAGDKEKISKESIFKSNINALLSLDAYKRIDEVWSIAENEGLACCVTDAPDAEIKEIFALENESSIDISCYHSVWHHAFFIKADINTLSSLIAVARSNSKYKFGFDISKISGESISGMLMKAKGAIEGAFFSPDSNVFVYDDEYMEWSANHIFTAQRHIDERRVSLVLNSIDDFYDKLEERGVQAYPGILFYNKIVEFLTKNRSNTEDSGDYFIIDIQHARKTFAGRDELIVFLHRLCDEWCMEFTDELQMTENRDFIAKIRNYIDENSHTSLDLSSLSKQFMISGKYLSSLFKKATGINLNRYINMVRVKKAAVMLEKTEIPIQDISYLCGYDDCSYFSKKFKQLVGLTPSEYRKNNQKHTDT